MKHFGIYLKGNEMFIKTEDEQAIQDLGIVPTEAVEFRNSVDSIIEVLTDEQAVEATVLFPVWAIDIDYKVNDRVRFENRLYKVLQAHTSQMGWEPSLAASLFAALLIDEENNNILNWIQPDSTNPYMVEDKVIHNEKYWVSMIDNNVWEPDIVSDNIWEEYIVDWKNGVSYGLNQKVFYQGEIYISKIEKNTSSPDTENWVMYVETDADTDTDINTDSSFENGGGIVNEWVQPDATNAYSIGDRVLFNGIIYESVIDGNVWSPEAYPAGWIMIEE
jgi:hypothetical protein